MSRLVLGLAMLGLASLGATAEARAQGTRFGLGAGLAAPTGDYGSVDKVGWHAAVKLDIAVRLAAVGVRVDRMHRPSSENDTAGTAVPGTTELAGGVARLVWDVPVSAPMFKP